MDKITNKPETSTVTRDTVDLAAPVHNVYEAVAIIAKRANQISVEVKQELSKKLEQFATFADTLEETFENREQIEISKYYERLPKPTLVSICEFENDEIYHRKAEV